MAALSSATTPSNANETTRNTIHLDDGDGKYILRGMISHIGKNTGSGHYVCHLKKDEKWVIFNDEKVALSHSPPLEHAYVYIFQRKDSLNKANLEF